MGGLATLNDVIMGQQLSLTQYPGTGGPLVDSLAAASAGVPAAAVATVLVARRQGNPIGWLLFAGRRGAIRRAERRPSRAAS